VAANLIQAFHAFRLCYCVGQVYIVCFSNQVIHRPSLYDSYNLYYFEQVEGRDPPECFRTAKIWFNFTEVSFLFHIVKCIAIVGYVFKIAPHPWILILVAITLPECIFKLYILYVVRRFMQDLRRSMQYLPKFTYIPVEDDVSAKVLVPRRDSDLKIDEENKANSLVAARMKHFKCLDVD